MTAAASFPAPPFAVAVPPSSQPRPLPASLQTLRPAAPPPLPVPGRAATAPAALTAEQDRLLREHQSLVRFVARSVADRLPPHVEFEELVSAGMLGLLDAARKFSADKNVQFRSYAQFRVRGAILDSLRTLDWSPRELRRRGRALQQARHTLEARLGRPGSESELAGEMGLSLASLQQLTGELRSLEIAALHAERGEDSDEDLLASLPADEKENPLLQVLAGEARERLNAAVDALAERERLILRLYYFDEMTMRQIGEVLGVVESRISQIHQEALRRLRIALGRPAQARARASRAHAGLAHAGRDQGSRDQAVRHIA